MWFPEDEPWQYRILDALPPGVDEAQLDAARKMTTTERIEAVIQMMELGEELQRAVAKSRSAP